jgi:putative heme utilization carrier protein HutX
MADAIRPDALPEDVEARVAQHLRENPGGVLERVAETFGVSTFEVVQCLPETERTIVGGDRFEEVLSALTQWGQVLLIVHTPSLVLECKGSIPPGSFGRGYFNLHGDSPIGGHIRADLCRHIVFVARPFMDRPSASIQFFDGAGAAMFKVFVARNAERELEPEQLSRFEALRQHLTA